jgi:hypothetical protein
MAIYSVIHYDALTQMTQRKSMAASLNSVRDLNIYPVFYVRSCDLLLLSFQTETKRKIDTDDQAI